MYLLRLLVWKLEIKVLLYLPVFAAPDSNNGPCEYKMKILVLSVCTVLLRYVAHRLCVHARRNIIGKLLHLG